MHLFLNVSVKEMQIFTRKYYLIAELLIFKYRWQNISNSNTPTCLAASYFSTGQRFCPQGARDHAAVNLWNTRLHCSSSVASQHPDLNPVDYQIWGNLQERVYRSCVHDVYQLKWRLIEEWEHFHQVFIDEVIRQWHPRLRDCIQAHGGHFEHRL